MSNPQYTLRGGESKPYRRCQLTIRPRECILNVLDSSVAQLANLHRHNLFGKRSQAGIIPVFRSKCSSTQENCLIDCV